jgi:hypothetical protein
MELSEKQIKRLKKLSKFGEDKDIATIENFIELDEKIDDVKEHLDSKFTNLQEELKKKLESELVLEIDKEELKGEDGYTPIKGVDYFDGKDGKNYVLTNLDKKQIAKSIDVPVVEKVIEKTEVIRETPIVTEIVKEVALKDTGEDIILKINEDETSFIKKEKIEDFDKTEQGILDRAVSIVDNRTSFLINKVSKLSEDVANINPVETQDLQAVTDLGSTTTNTITVAGLDVGDTTGIPEDGDSYFVDTAIIVTGTGSITSPTVNATNMRSDSYQTAAGVPVITPSGSTPNSAKLLNRPMINEIQDTDGIFAIDVYNSNLIDYWTDATSIDWSTRELYADDGTTVMLNWNTAGTADFGTNSITANSLIKSGGTSSQFLKADGSVDSSTYLTTIPTHTGEVTGGTALTLDKTAISNRADVTILATDILLFGDTSDSGNLKKGAVQDILDLTPAPDLSAYWKSDGTSTATGDWDLGSYILQLGGINDNVNNNLSIDPNYRYLYDTDGSSIVARWGAGDYKLYVNYGINSYDSSTLDLNGTLFVEGGSQKVGIGVSMLTGFYDLEVLNGIGANNITLAYYISAYNAYFDDGYYSANFCESYGGSISDGTNTVLIADGTNPLTINGSVGYTGDLNDGASNKIADVVGGIITTVYY